MTLNQTASASGAPVSKRTSAAVLLIPAGVILALEIGAVSGLYRNGVHFECTAMPAPGFCNALAAAPAGALSALLVVALLWIAGHPGLHAFWDKRRARPELRFAGLHAAGVAVFMGPLALLSNDMSGGAMAASLALWAVGMTTAAVGGALALVPAEGWRTLLMRPGPTLAVSVLLGLAAPAIGRLAQEAWLIDPIADLTFAASRDLLELAGWETVTTPGQRYLGAGGFAVAVADTCSGIEGIALILGFSSLYIWAFRDRLHVGRALLLLPIGAALSWGLNVVRIALLVGIGAGGRPELAVGGFHSHAGWLMFTVLAMAFLFVAHALPWLHRDDGGEAV